MATFQRAETIVIKGTIKDETSTLITPSTSTKMTITDPSGTEVVADQAVTFDSIGVWQYIYTPDVAAVAGAYHVRITAKDGTRVSITDSQFFLVT